MVKKLFDYKSYKKVNYCLLLHLNSLEIDLLEDPRIGLLQSLSIISSLFYFSFHFSFFKELCIGTYLFHKVEDGSRLIERKRGCPFSEGYLCIPLTYFLISPHFTLLFFTELTRVNQI